MRIVLAAFVLIFSSVTAFAQMAPKLRAEVSVSSDLVTIGDLLIGTYRHSSVPVLRSPALGETGKLSSGDIARILYERGVKAIDLAGIEHVTIRRVDNMMRRQKISSLLSYEISRQTNAPLSAIELVEADLPQSVRHDKVSGNEVRKARIVDVQIDEENDKFTAKLITTVNDQRRETLLIARGSILEQVFVLTDPLSVGSIVNSADISLKFMPKRLAKTGFSDPEMIVGRQLTRSLHRDDVLSKRDVRMPNLVVRNSDVLLKLGSSGMTITARGRAMQNGAFGDVVEVMNIRSKKLILGTVQADGSILVGGNGAPMTKRKARSEREKRSALYNGLTRNTNSEARL